MPMLATEGGIAEEISEPRMNQQQRNSRKLAAVIVALIVIGSSIFAVWLIFSRHWSIRDVAAAVINDDTPAKPGFKDSLAGKTVTVEGKVTNITIEHTNQGELYLAELDGFEDFNLVFWVDFPHEIGDRIDAEVSFEWSVCNEERHVYSPQISFPNIISLNSIEILSRANGWTSGAILTEHALPSERIDISVDYVDEPILLSDANCSLRNGRYSWASELMDFYGNYRDNNESDYISNLTMNHGPNGRLTFTDANADKYLDRGDYFTVNGLARPSMESGVYTSMLLVSWREGLPMPSYGATHWTMAYMIMNHKGLLSELDTPTPGGKLLTASLHDRLKAELVYLESYQPITWDDVDILLMDGVHQTNWNVSSASLNSTHLTTVVLPARLLGDLTVYCNVTDREGNGQLDELDLIELASSGGTHLSNSASYNLVIIYKPRLATICQATFRPESIPLSNMTASTLQDGVGFTFGPMHTGYNSNYTPIGVPWNEISIELSDGNGTVAWAPEESALRTGAASTEALASLNLGIITVRCNITDLDGNGWVNRGDRFTLRMTGSNDFLSNEIYSVKVVYETIPGNVFNYTFRG